MCKHVVAWAALVVLWCCLANSACRADDAALPPPREVVLPSVEPSGHPTVDLISVLYYAAPKPSQRPPRPNSGEPELEANLAPSALLFSISPELGPGGLSDSSPTLQTAPAVVVLPPSGGTARDPILRRLAHYLVSQGIACAVMDLPYHGRRRSPGFAPAAPFLEGNVASSVQAFRQSASDVRTVASWLVVQPGIDAHRLGVVGISLGAIVAHLVMGQDARLSAGVAVLGGGDLPDLYRTSVLVRLLRRLYSHPLDAAALVGLNPVDPLTYAARNSPRHVLMIEAARDLLVPPRDATELWEALGRPPIQWLDVDHFALVLAPEPAFRATAAYLWSIWDGHPAMTGDALPQAAAPTLKIGLLAEWGRPITPSLQWQCYTFLWRWDHLSLLHADLGLTGRGLFTGLGVTVTPFVDAGVSPRFDGHGIRPYVAFHVVF